jgi:feruloyl esterase
LSHRVSFSFLLVLLISVASPKDAFAQRPCEDLVKLSLTNATIASATSLAAGAFKPPSAPYQLPLRADLPAFCRVQGIARPTNDSEIKFEVWLPASGWNGKFEQVGNGGLAGTIPLHDMAGPLLRGYATAGTDDGHTGTAARKGIGQSVTPKK